jgi:adenosine deaminase
MGLCSTCATSIETAWAPQWTRDELLFGSLRMS